MTSQILKSPLPYLALLIAHLIWGGNFVVAKVTLEEFPSASLALLRFAFASLLIAPFFIIQTKKVKIDPKDYPKLITIGILIITLNITFFFEGMTKTTAINASVLTLIIPVLSVTLGWWFLKEKIYLINLLGIAVGLVGALVILELPQILVGNYSTQVMLGNFLIILASIAWVVGSVFSRQMLAKYPSLIVTSITFLVGTITFIIPAALEYFKNPSWPNQVTMIGFLGLMYMALLSSVSAYFLFEWGLARLGVTKANLFQYIEPFVASILAVMILGEKISIPFIVGAILIGCSVYLGTLAKEAHHRYKPHRH